MYLVAGCFDWIGFHLTEHLLHQGIGVIGLDQIESEKQENMELFVGRNSLFQHVRTKEALPSAENISNVRYTINVNEEDRLFYKQFNEGTCINFVLQADNADQQQMIQVELPLLYGEWMPREEESFQHNGREIRFDSDEFYQEAIYIEDFIKNFVRILEEDHIPNVITYSSATSKQIESDDELRKNTILIDQEQDVNKRLKQINNHYRKFHFVYS